MLENNDSDDREYIDAIDQIREVLIHQHYLSQKDIEICQKFDLTTLAYHAEIENIRTLHNTLESEYGVQPGYLQFGTCCKQMLHKPILRFTNLPKNGNKTFKFLHTKSNSSRDSVSQTCS